MEYMVLGRLTAAESSKWLPDTGLNHVRQNGTPVATVAQGGMRGGAGRIRSTRPDAVYPRSSLVLGTLQHRRRRRMIGGLAD